MARRRTGDGAERQERGASTADLAKLVHSALEQMRAKRPRLRVLESLFSILFDASLRTEEAEPIRCTVCYLRPVSGSAVAGPSGLAYDWECHPLDEPLPLNARSLTKLAPAADPFVSSMAVYSDNARDVYIWGLVDQEIHYRRFLGFEHRTTTAVGRRPGLFQVSVDGPGHIVVVRDMVVIAELRRGELVGRHNSLYGANFTFFWYLNVDHALKETRKADPAISDRVAAAWMKEYYRLGMGTLARILLQVQRYRHGGALLFRHRKGRDGLNVKYPIRYDRLRKTLREVVDQWLIVIRLREAIRAEASAGDGSVRRKMVNEFLGASAAVRELELELEGCIRFVASLSRVDGLVLFDDHFTVLGFGVEIIAKRDPACLYRTHGDLGGLRRIPNSTIEQFGTRHRSMMRQCNERYGGEGIVVSQDGDVRVVSREGAGVSLHENVALELSLGWQPDVKLPRRQRPVRRTNH